MILVILMYKRYIIVGLVFFLLVGAYFIFFNKDNGDKEYKKYYDKLVEREEYSDSLDGVTLTIFENEDNGKYNYVVTFDNVNVKQSDVKILIADGNSSKDNMEYYPSFGIVDNEGYSIILSSEEKKDKEVKGVNLTIVDSDKIEYLLIYFSGNSNEQFVRVKVSNYLG